MNFVIQTGKYGQAVTDCGKALPELIDLELWLHPDQKISFRFQAEHDNALIREDEVPVGTVEWTEKVSGRTLVPINVPTPAYISSDLIHRRCFLTHSMEAVRKWYKKYGEKEKMPTLFVKSADRVKGMDMIMATIETDLPEGHYFMSEKISLDEEFRIFVYKGEVLDVKCYLGNWETGLSPDEVGYIHDLVKRLALPLKAYTIDIARRRDGKDSNGHFELLEVHNFVACGLYGMDTDRLPFMLCAAWQDEREGGPRSLWPDEWLSAEKEKGILPKEVLELRYIPWLHVV